MSQPATFNQIIRLITYGMRNAMMLEEGQEPNGEQIAEGLNRLNDLTNYLQTEGIRLWTQTDVVIPLVTGTSQYSLTGTYGKPYRIPRDLAYMLYIGGTQTVKSPVTSLSQQEWTLLTQGNQQGMVSQIYVEKLSTQLRVNTFLTPDSATATNWQLHVIVQQQMALGEKITDATQFPEEWYVGLQWILADEICTGQPDSIVQRCAQKSAYYKDKLNGWDVEDTQTFFVPDPRMGYVQRSFR